MKELGTIALKIWLLIMLGGILILYSMGKASFEYTIVFMLWIPIYLRILKIGKE